MNDQGHRPAPSTIAFFGASADFMYHFRLPLIRELERRGHQAVVIAPTRQDCAPGLFDESAIEHVDWPIARDGLNPIADIRGLLAAWRFLRRRRPAIVFAQGAKAVIYAMLLSWLAGVPRRVSMIPGLGFAFIPGPGRRRRLAGIAGRAGYRLALPRTHAVIFQNPDDCRALADAGALLGDTQVALVNGSGVDMSRFEATPPVEGPTVFLMVARLLRDKGVYEYVEAARLVKKQEPQIGFLLVGDGDPRNPASVSSDEIDEWNVSGIVKAVGYVADPRPYYRACHVYVLPSYREGTPRTNLEAMATGRAVITTDVPGCRETVEPGENGLIVPPADAAALAAAMLELAGDPDRVRRMGEAGLALCRARYELGIVTRATADVIEGVSPTAASPASPACDTIPSPGDGMASTRAR